MAAKSAKNTLYLSLYSMLQRMQVYSYVDLSRGERSEPLCLYYIKFPLVLYR